MLEKQNKDIVRRLFKELNKGNFDVFDEIFAEDFIDRYPAGGETPTKEGLKQYIVSTCKPFPDFHWSPEDIIAEGDKVVCRLMMQGTETGGFMGMPPTGNKVIFAGVSIFRFANNKVVERWYVGDNMTLFRQLGLV